MKTRTLVAFLYIAIFSLRSLFAAPLTTDKLDELAKLPYGLKVVHTPDKVPAQKGGPSGRAYTWIYKTSVTATNGSAVVQEFGTFVWRDNHWVSSNFTGKPFTSADFAAWYSCPGAKLVGGQAFTDTSNWSGGDELRESKMKWYYIAVMADGRRVKGEADVEILPQVSADQNLK